MCSLSVTRRSLITFVDKLGHPNLVDKIWFGSRGLPCQSRNLRHQLMQSAITMFENHQKCPIWTFSLFMDSFLNDFIFIGLKCCKMILFTWFLNTMTYLIFMDWISFPSFIKGKSFHGIRWMRRFEPSNFLLRKVVFSLGFSNSPWLTKGFHLRIENTLW